ncbi:hypothetical protein [Aureimonas sp. SK2]|uniref:hypothetical protein n=1 Tax=Aureimonas sp. SK2 TaxID=3015992 RepID=UPI0024441CD7|nr:hypothetical protein [Aureimonas sp. SK2]
MPQVGDVREPCPKLACIVASSRQAVERNCHGGGLYYTSISELFAEWGEAGENERMNPSYAPLGTARGLILGCLISTAIWMAIANIVILSGHLSI